MSDISPLFSGASSFCGNPIEGTFNPSDILLIHMSIDLMLSFT
ncbi:hypothetical protein UF75_4058 [Desulfosporosinus sp. I2]|nr:hypothetical protein UF75_4058 [Desulfosporosinus sp. I2]